MNLNFNTGVPAATNNPSTDQSPMQVNNVSAAAIWNVDHYGFGENLGGWHDVIHIPQVTGNADPAPTTVPANAGQLYSKTVGGKLELFHQSPAGVISQLTPTGSTFSSTTNGYTYLMGGILMQWGAGVSTGGAGTNVSITFPVNFTNVFSIQMTPLQPTTVNLITTNQLFGTTSAVPATPPYTGFTGIIAKNGVNFATPFYWVAIGN